MKYLQRNFQTNSSIFSSFSLLLHALILLTTILLAFTLLFFLFTPLQHAIAQFTVEEAEFQYSAFNISSDDTNNLRNQILLFYISGAELDTSFFSPFEIQHYEDVKNVLFYTIIVFILLSIYSLWYCISSIKAKQFSKLIVHSTIAQFILILICVFIVLFFDFFWLAIFHEFLFKGGYMILEPQFVSYYLFSHEFFMVSIIFIVSMTILSLEGLKHYFKRLNF